MENKFCSQIHLGSIRNSATRGVPSDAFCRITGASVFSWAEQKKIIPALHTQEGDCEKFRYMNACVVSHFSHVRLCDPRITAH